MLPHTERHQFTRRQRVSLALLVSAAVVALGGLYVMSRPSIPGLPAVGVQLAWQSPTPSSMVLAPTENQLASPAAVVDEPPPGETPQSDTLPPWLTGASTPARPNEPGPTSTPSEYAAYFPGVAYEPTSTPTQLPEPPAAPPTPRWPDGLSSQTASKLSLHVISNNDPYIMEFVRRVRPRVIKSVDDLGWLAEVKQASPNTITIGRISGQNESWPEQLDPETAAQTYIAQNMSKYLANTGVDYWEGWNEFVPVTTARWQWFASFEAARACDMQAIGLHAAVGAFPAGSPEYSDMALFMPALEAAHRCGAIFTVHEVVTPLPGCGIFNGVAGVIPGAPLIPGKDVGYTSLRYRFWYEGYLKPAGIGDLPLVISELAVGGIVPGQSCNGPGGEGWKGFVPFWIQNGVGPDGPQSWVNLLEWYDSELRQDPYVIGTTIFTAGAKGDPHWDSEDLHDIMIPLAYYETSQK